MSREHAEADLSDALAAVNRAESGGMLARADAERARAALRSGTPRGAVLATVAALVLGRKTYPFEAVLARQLDRLEGELNDYRRCEAAQSGQAWRAGHTLTIERD